MLSVKLRDEAKVDLLEIMGFIAERNEQAAYDLQERIERSLEHLPEHPYLYKPVFALQEHGKLWFIQTTSFSTR